MKRINLNCFVRFDSGKVDDPLYCVHRACVVFFQCSCPKVVPRVSLLLYIGDSAVGQTKEVFLFCRKVEVKSQATCNL